MQATKKDKGVNLNDKFQEFYNLALKYQDIREALIQKLLSLLEEAHVPEVVPEPLRHLYQINRQESSTQEPIKVKKLLFNSLYDPGLLKNILRFLAENPDKYPSWTNEIFAISKVFVGKKSEVSSPHETEEEEKDGDEVTDDESDVSFIGAELNDSLDGLSEFLGNLSLKDTIAADVLVDRIKLLIEKSAKLKIDEFASLKKELDEILFYFQHHEKVLGAVFAGGLINIRQIYEPELLRIKLLINEPRIPVDIRRFKAKVYGLNTQERQKVSNGFTLFAQKLKVKRAYAEITQGKKFQRAYGCGFCFLSRLPELETLSKQPVYIFFNDILHYFDGEAISVICDKQDIVTSIMKRLKITKKDKDKPIKRLTQKRLQIISTLSGHIPPEARKRVPEFDTKHPYSQQNPIKRLSRRNLHGLINHLKNRKGAEQKFGLLPDELELFSALLNLPFKLQHATNFYYPIANSGGLDSYTEIRRHNPSYESPFSTKGNIKKLGNGGFVFFRVYIDGANTNVTRYGATSIHFDMSLLRYQGWISLHDQLVPFSTPGAEHFYWGDKRLFRIADVCGLEKDKGLKTRILYSYRITPFNSLDKGKKDTLKSFGAKNGIAIRQRAVEFTQEIFYGEDILPGIALSIIRELWQLRDCGFRDYFLNMLKGTKVKTDRVLLLAELIKGLFRIEGKYPSALKLTADAPQLNRGSCTATSGKAINAQQFFVENPDGDGRYNMDMTVNSDAMQLSTLKEKKMLLEADLSVAQRQRAKFAKNKDKKEQYTEWNEKTEHIRKKLGQVISSLNDSAELRDEVVTYFQEEFGIPKLVIDKVSTSKLYIIRDKYEESLADESVTFDELIIIPEKILDRYSSLIKENLLTFEDLLTTSPGLLSLIEGQEEPFYSLLSEGNLTITRLQGMPLNKLLLISKSEYLCEALERDLVALESLMTLSLEEIEQVGEYDISFAIVERELAFDELMRLFREDERHLQYLSLDDDKLVDEVLDQAPDIDDLLLDYARDYDVDFNWVMEQLCESEQEIFKLNLGWYDEEPEEEHTEEYDDIADDYPEEEQDQQYSEASDVCGPDEFQDFELYDEEPEEEPIEEYDDRTDDYLDEQDQQYSEAPDVSEPDDPRDDYTDAQLLTNLGLLSISHTNKDAEIHEEEQQGDDKVEKHFSGQ